ncbi:hypothetical protein LguiB_023123 [Lonicera macranthoides]
MDSSYSSVPKKSLVELKVQGETETPPRSPQASSKLLSVNEELGFMKTHAALDMDDDFDDLPPPPTSSSSGSGLYGAVFNLSTTIVGAGIMALPATMKVLGLFVGFFLIVLMGILTEISIELLVRFTVQCNGTTYGEVVQAALGRPGRIISEICIIVNNAGLLVVYLIIMGDVMSGSLRHIGVFDQWLGHGVWDHRKVVILVAVVFFLAPLCAMDKIDSLSLTSAASVAIAVVFVIVACSIAFIKLVEGKDDPPRLVPDFGSKKAILDLLVVIPIMCNAYVCHFNVQPIYNELEGRSPEKMSQVGRITIVICVLVYAATAISGYLLFGEGTESDVLINFDKDLGIRFSSALNYIVRVGYILHLILVFPVIHFSLRETVDALVFDGAPPLSQSRRRCLTLTVILLTLTYFVSTMIPNIWTAFKFTGATTAVSLGFTFPALIALRFGSQGSGLSPGEKVLSWFMLVLAILVTTAGIIGNIDSIKSK